MARTRRRSEARRIKKRGGEGIVNGEEEDSGVRVSGWTVGIVIRRATWQSSENRPPDATSSSQALIVPDGNQF
jgi:hypothetical protein